jgi:hypothetical protein
MASISKLTEEDIDLGKQQVNFYKAKSLFNDNIHDSIIEPEATESEQHIDTDSSLGLASEAFQLLAAIENHVS